MPRQYVTTHIALIGCVCLALLMFLPPAGTEPGAPATGPGLDFDSPASISVLVNKDRQLSDPGFRPPDLADVHGVQLRRDAAEAYSRMSADAAAGGSPLRAVSGFRSAEAQAELHAAYIRNQGRHAAEAISARPGHSEHQTGLAVDIGNPDAACSLQACFKHTPAGAWTAANAHRYGFIIRYPEGKELTTGYSYEPWHLRYVGTDLAARLHGEGITLEEYAGLTQ
ncbi:M15 family metallopeptidase [Arthrobacter sp. YD2]|uniref:M15 family metallopeptidase n=1 Tax=Arthrobacter sp. YD2 TaxID=3058046 RepID=UPI0025B4CB0E|nr:M15 family metallopeptidase [Arthrobacter sp. YD2]MDN3904740.1 M15 family metallopeptidase [Arthrobacter sp. YD2]